MATLPEEAATSKGVTVRPFKGFVPPVDLIAEVSSPPYDVLDTEEARTLVEGHEKSFLRVNKSQVEFDASVSEYDDRVYAKGREMLEAFITKGWLVEEEKEALYVYSQTMDGRTQYGLVCEASADEYERGLIKKHELTRKKKEDDRTRLTDEQSANVGPIFLCYKKVDEINAVIAKAVGDLPYAKWTVDGVTHALWKMTEAATIAEVRELFATRVPALYVADGHHRTASAWRISGERRKYVEAKGGVVTGDEDFNYFLAVLFAGDELTIMDYNRVVYDMGDVSPDALLAALAKDWEVSAPISGAPPKTRAKFDFRMYLTDKGWFSLKPKAHIIEAVGGDPTRSLDVSILTEFLLEPILNIEDLRTDERIGFVGGIHGLPELERRAEAKKGCAFGLYPTSVDEMMAIADAGLIMPPKSTWFEPKLRSGVVVRTFKTREEYGL